MKKSISFLLLTLFAYVLVMADDNVKLLRVYKNGEVTTIPLAYIDSIDHSKFDTDSILWDDYKTSVLWSADSTYRQSLNEVDSIVVDNVSIQQLSADIEQIKEHLQTFDNQPVDQFQDNLLSWFNNECNYVYKATLSPSKDHIVVSMKNGMDIYVSFVDTDIFESDKEESANTKPLKRSNYFDCYDVSSIPGEEIINPNILYIQGRSMPSKYDEEEKSNANSEWNTLNEVIDDSPTNASLKKISKSLSFLEEDLSQYGLIIISQTHGQIKTGQFEVEDRIQSQWWQRTNITDENERKMQVCVIPVINVYIHNNVVKKTQKEDDVFLVSANFMRTKFRNNPVYASYCFSSYLGNGTTNASLYGYVSPIWYCYPSLNGSMKYPSTDSLITRVDRFFNGSPYRDALYLKNYIEYDLVIAPALNKQTDIQRYFSISIDPITQKNEKGNPIITGKINGYKNLKEGVTYVVYSHKGKEKFTPESSGVQTHNKGIKIESDGTFTYYSYGERYDNSLEYGETYGFMIGFYFNGNDYYGDVEYYTHNLCPDNNHPHMIDLGIGTKWRCCNVGANKPEQYGGYYAWGNTEEKSEYNWDNTNYMSGSWYVGNIEKYNKDDNRTILEPDDDAATVNCGGSWRMPTKEECEELIKKTYVERYSVNGISGYKFSGQNGASIFLPAAGIRSGSKTTDDDTAYYWSSSLDSKSDSQASYMFLPPTYYLIGVKNKSRYYGCSVRPVCK